MVMSQVICDSADPCSWRVEGVVDYDTVSFIAEQGNSLLKKHAMKHCTIDFSGLTDFNSALLSVLLCWCRRASSLGIQMTFKSAPDMAYQMAEVYGLTFLLET